MKISELVDSLLTLKDVEGDLEVCGQSHGCCRYPHEIREVISWDDDGEEERVIMIRV